MSAPKRIFRDKGYLLAFKFMPLKYFYKTMDNWALKPSYAGRVNDPLENVPRGSAGELLMPANLPPFVSFSEKMDMPAMWGHYADNARGVCLVFIFPMLKNINEHMKQKKIDSYCIHKGFKGFSECSHEQLDNVHNGFFMWLNYKTQRAEFNNSNDGIDLAQYADLLSTKAECWQYESELRLVLRSEDADKAEDGHILYSWPMDHFVGVLLGPKCTASEHDVGQYIELAYKREMNRRRNTDASGVDDASTDNAHVLLNEPWLVYKTEQDPEKFRFLNPFISNGEKEPLLSQFFNTHQRLIKNRHGKTQRRKRATRTQTASDGSKDV